jgi:hypothetical protein
MRKVIEVFVNNIRRAAAYPFVLEELHGPSDEEFIECIRRQMRRGRYSAAEIKAARFVVRDLATGSVVEWSDLGSTRGPPTQDGPAWRPTRHRVWRLKAGGRRTS